MSNGQASQHIFSVRLHSHNSLPINMFQSLQKERTISVEWRMRCACRIGFAYHAASRHLCWSGWEDGGEELALSEDRCESPLRLLPLYSGELAVSWSVHIIVTSTPKEKSPSNTCLPISFPFGDSMCNLAEFRGEVRPPDHILRPFIIVQSVSKVVTAFSVTGNPSLTIGITVQPNTYC